MGTVTITNHPLIQHKLSILRDKNTGTREFRQLIAELAMLECYEATRDLPLQPKLIETPIGPCNANELARRITCTTCYCYFNHYILFLFFDHSEVTP